MTRVFANKIIVIVFIFLTGLYYCQDIDDENYLHITNKVSGERLMDSETFVANEKIKRSAEMQTSERKRKKKQGKGKGKKGKKPKNKGFSCKKEKVRTKM